MECEILNLVCCRERQVHYDHGAKIPEYSDYVDLFNNYTLIEIIQILYDAGFEEVARDIFEATYMMYVFLEAPIQQTLELVSSDKIRYKLAKDGYPLDSYTDDMLSRLQMSGMKGTLVLRKSLKVLF